MNSEIVFVKVHAPKRVLRKFAEYFNIPIKYQQSVYLPPSVPRFKCRQTVLTEQNYMSPIFERAEDLLSGNQPKEFISNERSLIVYNILKRIEYGSNIFKIGIEHLLSSNVFIAAYPLHDGTAKWNNDPNAPLNARQLLARYWVNYEIILKAQPLHLLENYYGDNIALYFALMEYYNSMLIFPILAGLLVIIYGIYLASIFNEENFRSFTDKVILCPVCQHCTSANFSSIAYYYKMSIAFDNSFNVCYALFMSIWAAVCMVLWKRRQSVIDLQWNILNSELEESDIRPEFELFAKHERISELGSREQYIPWWTKAWRVTFSYSVVLFMILVVIAMTVVTIVGELLYYRCIDGTLSSTVVSAFLTAILIDLLRRIYSRVVVWLTELEVPKTQTDFDSSYIFKLFIFSFVNNYGALFYLAFIKGLFYTYPGDSLVYKSENYDLKTDICYPPNCMAEIVILINILLLFLPMLTHALNFIARQCNIWRSRRSEKIRHIPHSQLPQWEKDFQLNEITHLDLFSQYDEMVAQFGYITIFAFACPYSGLLAVIFNTIKLKFEATKFVEQSRRHQGKRTASIGAWLDAMKFISYIAIISNAGYIALISDVIIKTYVLPYLTPDKHQNNYMFYSLSKYAVEKKYWPKLDVDVCYYIGEKYPPGHRFAYNNNIHYYKILTVQFILILLFQNFVLIITVILGYLIPEQPQAVKDKYAEDVAILRKSNAIKSTFALF